ncbi:MAG: formate/nitrite transporter family protein [Actinobacteria bacterium]|nr:formate/nitrite transporter family protein [Actinomycetota bacterium]MBW3649167.1 formate/nitrite transporter family protein [Actinomycetota bacterium]
MTEELTSTFRRSLEQGEERLGRNWPTLLATGAVGGFDVGMGVLALFLVEEVTGSALLGGLAFGIGFIALTLASSELFTENFLVPVMAVAAGRASPMAVVRLWAGTGLTNLAGGWIMMAVVSIGVPQVHETAIRLGTHYTRVGIGRESFAAAVLGGSIITLMTWMQRGTDSMPGKLVAAVAAAFLLAAGSLFHAIVVSLIMFAALQAGAPFGYLDWLGVLAWSTLGNLVGGLALVTVMRLVQVGKARVSEERSRAGQRIDGKGRAQAPKGTARATR